MTASMGGFELRGTDADETRLLVPTCHFASCACSCFSS